jgi:uncharacterized membrane protein YfcA
MRWLILLPAGPGALLGGWLGEHLGLRASMAFAGVSVLVIAALAWRQPIIRQTRVLPVVHEGAGLVPSASAAQPAAASSAAS